MKLLQVTTSDGLILKGLFSQPSAKTKKIIIHIHGMAGNITLNSYYPNMHSNYIKEGYSFLVPENRGSGSITFFDSIDGLKLIGNTFEIFEESVYDIQAWVDKAIELGYEEVWLQGHSLGPSKIAYFMSQGKPQNIAGLLLISPSDMIGLVNDPLGIKDREIMEPEALRLSKEGKEDQILIHKLWESQFLSAKTYLNLFGDKANTAIFNYWRNNQWDVINNISVPVLAITGTEDDGIVSVMDPYEAMKKLESELKKSPRFESIVYECATHDFTGFEEDIVRDVLKFIKT